MARLEVLTSPLEYSGLFSLLVHFFKDSFFDQIVFSAPDWRTRDGGTACRKTSANPRHVLLQLRLPRPSGQRRLPAPPKPVPTQLPAVLARVNGEDSKESGLRSADQEHGSARRPAGPRRTAATRSIATRSTSWSTYTVLSQESAARKHQRRPMRRSTAKIQQLRIAVSRPRTRSRRRSRRAA